MSLKAFKESEHAGNEKVEQLFLGHACLMTFSPVSAKMGCRQRAARAKLRQAILSIERNPETVKSIASFPSIVSPL